MEKCRHGLDIEKACSRCVGDAMKTMPAVSPQHQRMIDLANRIAAPANEHEHTDAVHEDFYYPDHDGRTESPTFIKTKHEGKAAGVRCAITGQKVKLEAHHGFLEWAFQNAVDWHTVRGIALGQIKELPVRDPHTWLPTGEMAPVEGFLIYWIIMFFKWRGFDFEAFDPDKPETFVDSPQAMIWLHENLHRGKNHGAHEVTGPIFLLQAFPFVDGFVFSPDVLEAQHRAASISTISTHEVTHVKAA